MTHRAFVETNAALRRMNDRLEEETKRIAHIVHDEAGQLLSAVHLALAVIADDLNPAARERLADVRGLLDRVEVELRRVSQELRPLLLEELGLRAALEQLAAGISERTDVLVSVEGALGRRLAPPIETALYRVVQEALSNVSRHSHATRVRIVLTRRKRGIQCSVRDNGNGFDVEDVMSNYERGLGLKGMQERLSPLGGSLRIASKPGKGTELVISIPVED